MWLANTDDFQNFAHVAHAADDARSSLMRPCHQ
jgi:hypothetical protein